MSDALRLPALGALALLAAGCSQSVRVSGTVFATHGFEAPPLADAEITVVSPPSTNVLATTVTGSDGSFILSLPPAIGVALEVRAEGYATTIFHGNSPFSGELAVLDHDVFGVTEAELAAERARFAGCEGADGPGAVVFGEVRVFGLVDPITGDSPLTSEGQVDVLAVGDDGDVSATYGGCYLDEAGAAHDPTAEFTGESGRFAVFGVEPGLHELQAQWQAVPGEWIANYYPAWVPAGEEQVVLPQWPAWVDPPGF